MSFMRVCLYSLMIGSCSTVFMPSYAAWAATIPPAADSGAVIDTTANMAAPISLSFLETDVRSVFAALAELAGVNVILDPSLKGNVTVTLKNLSISEAIDTVAQVANVSAVLSDKLLVVSAKKPETGTSIADTQIRVYALQYAEPAKVVEIASAILPDLKVMGEDTAKRVAVRGSEADLRQFESFLQQFDKAGQQVLIEARIQEVSREALRQLGITWTLPTFTGTWNPQTSTLPVTMDKLAATLDAMETTGDATLLASPHITAVSGETATIFVGDRVPVVLKGGSDKEDTIEYIEAGISLEIIARVGEDGMITTHVKPQVSSIANWTPQDLPQVRSRNAETTVRVRDGQPIVIAGLMREENHSNTAHVTGLGSLPVIGALFRWGKNNMSQMETVIILTPRLVNDTSAAAPIH